MTEQAPKQPLSFFQNSAPMRYRDILYVYSKENNFIWQISQDKQTNQRLKPKWSKQEIKVLMDGVTKFGVGKWNEIYEHRKHFFEKYSRTPKDLEQQFMLSTTNG